MLSPIRQLCKPAIHSKSACTTLVTIQHYYRNVQSISACLKVCKSAEKTGKLIHNDTNSPCAGTHDKKKKNTRRHKSALNTLSKESSHNSQYGSDWNILKYGLCMGKNGLIIKQSKQMPLKASSNSAFVLLYKNGHDH